MSDFKKELRDLINRYSKENHSNTPDDILALFMDDCLRAFGYAVQRRDGWYGETHKRPRVVTEAPPRGDTE